MKKQKLKDALMLGMIVCFPISIALAPGPISKWCQVAATSALLMKLHLESKNQ